MDHILEGKQIAFIGAGNMAEAIIKGLLDSGTVAPDQVAASDVVPARRELMADIYGIRLTDENTAMVKDADIVMLAVKPQVVSAVMTEIGPHMGAEKLLISIVAGLPVRTMTAALKPGTRIIRTIPNTPVFVGEGMVVLGSGDTARAEDYAVAEAIFGPVARTLTVEEKLMDAVLGISGSGPAYVFMMIEALADGGVRMGLTRDVAMTLASQTLLGSAKMCLETGTHPGQLKDMVTSPGGTTAAALFALENGKIRATLMAAVEAAARKSEELGKLA
ncbi:pyrroline-5-carboxylate reductase [Desulfonema ishimotonii]|uniref:Pyrroline-5-carboxylate reductase n=1 Tax=Desulfonema ishimotonii TaxID=45657 RepID=A0A401FS48_9BACT|nr:pyrroline-5-carboxylate reductase [Desulfonema ishimotonii]GBC59773.1 pyrroline-5-carboxylate reductase [Desulfonema ishimotonii]